MVPNVVSRSEGFIEITEKDMVTRAVFYCYFCNTLEDLCMTDDPYASRFAGLLERRFSETIAGALAESAYVLTPD
jgi:hypothetical protein